MTVSSIKSFNHFNDSEILSSIIKEFGIECIPHPIGQGQYGRAYSCGSKVIKITTSEDEFDIAKNLVGKSIWGSVKYFKVKRLSDLFIILMEKADPIPKDQVQFIDDLCGLSEYGNIDLEDIQEITGKKLSKLQISIFHDFKSMAESLMSNGISIDDLHVGNIGYLNGHLVHYDPMGISSFDY